MNNTNFQLHYEGFLESGLLWNNDKAIDIPQLELPLTNTRLFNEVIPSQLRLGKLVERFVCYQLRQQNGIEILAENIQIQRDKLTLGEIDALIKVDDKPIHLEIAYKFYLYDASFGSHELEHWIGPNRKDNLYKKITKLKDKQFPILHTPECEHTLHKLNFKAKDCIQSSYFKAQLFVPLHMKAKLFTHINTDCINGFYMTMKHLKSFSDCKFYLPKKIDWLLKIQIQTPWITFEQFLPRITAILNAQTSPLCWLKKPNGETQKCFIVWW